MTQKKCEAIGCIALAVVPAARPQECPPHRNGQVASQRFPQMYDHLWSREVERQRILLYGPK